MPKMASSYLSPPFGLWPRKWVWASAGKKRLAAACGKPNALLAPPKGG